MMILKRIARPPSLEEIIIPSEILPFLGSGRASLGVFFQLCLCLCPSRQTSLGALEKETVLVIQPSWEIWNGSEIDCVNENETDCANETGHGHLISYFRDHHFSIRLLAVSLPTAMSTPVHRFAFLEVH
mmetsp:Transcript_25129/g.43376  ORF Transcript_25129/g.43376 Transcript_25129/m.43376 type:complete len:129 (-) Transcript_25129:241-627(-)